MPIVALAVEWPIVALAVEGPKTVVGPVELVTGTIDFVSV